MKTAIYALSADPLTFGHIAVIEKAVNMFDHVIVAIGNNPNKKYLLTPFERKIVALQSLFHFKNVTVKMFDGALVDFAIDQDANVIVRGLRNVNDFQYEMDLATINKTLNDDIETCFVFTDSKYNSVSSSASKGIVKEGFFSNEFLPLPAKNMLEKVINKQVFIGVTGLMGSGKSTFSKSISEFSLKQDIKIHNIDLDYLCHEIYDETSPTFKRQRDQITKVFGTLNRNEIGRIVFKDDSKLKELNNIFKKPLQTLIRKKTKGLEGIILLNGATIINNDFLPLINNRVIFMELSDEERHNRCLNGRGISIETVKARDAKMPTIQEQKNTLRAAIKRDNFGEGIYIYTKDEPIDYGSCYDHIYKTFYENTY